MIQRGLPPRSSLEVRFLSFVAALISDPATAHSEGGPKLSVCRSLDSHPHGMGIHLAGSGRTIRGEGSRSCTFAYHHRVNETLPSTLDC
jgi:hypothetical protein